MNFIQKSIEHVHRIFPGVYNSRAKRGSYHFCLGFRRNTLLAIGLNKPERMDSKAFQFARKLGLKSKIAYPYLHSEESLISRLISLDEIDNSINIVSLRLNKFGELGNSAPCANCKIILSAYGFNRVYYSDKEGRINRL